MIPTLTIQPGSVSADGVSTAEVAIVVLRADGTPIPDVPIALRANAHWIKVTLPPVTDAQGMCKGLISSPVAGQDVISAFINVPTASAGLPASGNVVFTPLPPAAGIPDNLTSSFVAEPNVVASDGVTTALLTLTVLDSQINPVANAPVAFSSTGSNYTFTPASGTTNASGRFTETLRSTTAQVMNILATIGSFNASASVTFVSGAASSFIVVATPAVIPSGQATSITVTAYDAYGNLANGYTGTGHFSSSDATAVLPANTAFAPGNAGALTFTNGVILNALSNQTVSANDIATPSITGSTTLQVTTTVAAISHGPSAESTCVVLATGSVKCWGNNVAGNLGYGDTLSRGKSTNEMGGNLPS